MYENIQRRNKIKGPSITYKVAVKSGILIYQNVHIDLVKIWAMCYTNNQTQMSFIFVVLFSNIGQCFRPAQKKSLENQKSNHVRINKNNIPYFL